ncbi:TonB-dependent receptor [Hymenobacter sp. GOD-10R]|uniref:SusC/RagA family TonB-linked outer membrane protein n=1 Tax=Hymenobacter sp. GOD-10R TaxID=3093922 RepID=UPI002D7911F8|nr:TonB-dependent receptor [Hymenobacter sp. GOD-10R]WRQ29806.1 TonB-dependent receptor [Hymenobacter sp. GOD-10R]
MKQKSLLILVWCLLLATVSWAQNRTITGKVSGPEGAGLPGVTILERGTTNGTSSNADGDYSLTVKPGATLVFSSIGMESQTVTVGSSSALNVTLKSNATELNEAVVVGYGQQSKADLTGSITQISGRDVQDQPVQSFEQAIQGKAPGVFIENSSGKLGQGIKVRVRGTSSVSAGTQPLYVVDGIPVISDNLSGTSGPTNPIADLNPNDIESISILKDASASAIYGSRGANGVVLITTRRGRTGQTRFTLGYQTGRSTPTHKKDFLNATEYVELLREAGANTGQAAAVETRLQRYAAGTDYTTGAVNQDWQDEAFQKAPFNQYDLSASGGSDKTHFYVSGLYSKQNGIIVGNKFEKISARFNLDHKVNDRMTIGLNFSTTRTLNDRLANDNAFSSPLQIVALSPITPLIDPRTGLLSGALDPATGLPSTNYPVYYNPLLNTIGSKFQTTVYRQLGNVFAQYEFAKGLTFRSELGLDVISQREEQYYGRVTQRNSGQAAGTGTDRRVFSGRYTTNNYLTYRHTFAENHLVEVVGGMSYEGRNANSNSITGQQFPSDAYTKLLSAAVYSSGTSTETNSALLSYFARANYSFASKYLLTLSGRVDGSTRFGENNRYGFFPAASVGWLLTEEPFLQGNTVLSMLKPRISYGATGNESIGDSQYPTLYYAVGYNGTPGQAPFQLGNPDLKWETTVQADAGIEFGFLNNRISGEVDVYQKKTHDLLLNVNVPGTTGFNSQFRNVGKMENKGIEATVTTRNLEGAFTWTTNLNASINSNKVTDLQGQVIEGGFLNRAVAGQPIGVFFGREYAGVNPDNGDALYYLNTTNTDGSVNRGTTNDPNAAQRVLLGNPNPNWTAGATNTVAWKGIDLTFTFQGVFGNQVYDGGGPYQAANASNGYDNQTKDQLRRWQKPGDITDVPQARLFGGNGVTASSRYVYDGSYVRLKTVTLGYNLPTTWLKYVKMQSARIYFSGVNLLTFTDYKGWDPEVNTDYLSTSTATATSLGPGSTALGNISQGNDFYSAPQAKTYTLGINIGF